MLAVLQQTLQQIDKLHEGFYEAVRATIPRFFMGNHEGSVEPIDLLFAQYKKDLEDCVEDYEYGKLYQSFRIKVGVLSFINKLLTSTI